MLQDFLTVKAGTLSLLSSLTLLGLPLLSPQRLRRHLPQHAQRAPAPPIVVTVSGHPTQGLILALVGIDILLPGSGCGQGMQCCASRATSLAALRV